MSWQRFMSVLRARNKEFLRDRASLSWNILLPILIVAAFAITFSGDRLDVYKVGVYGDSNVPTAQRFLHTQHLDFITVESLDQAIAKVERHQLDLLIDPSRQRYWVNDQSPRGYLLERLLRGSVPVQYAKQAVSGEPIRYVDWLVPGVLGMNMMFSALFGVGYVIVRYRKNGVLKRLKATPVSAFEFLAGQIASRLWLILVITTLVYAGTDLFINFRMIGSYFNLLLVFALGTISVISLGLIIAARIANEELANGLLNIISWPMMFLSGVWFSLEGLNPLLQKLALCFPLTHVTQAARAVMIDGAGFKAIAPHLVVLTLMSAVFLAIGSYTFRWE